MVVMCDVEVAKSTIPVSSRMLMTVGCRKVSQ
jgi:hypothetical protein